MSGLEILCVGQAVVDCITRKIEDDPYGAGKRIAESITLNVGGDAVNEAAALARMGRRVGLVCGLGEDHAGRMILEEMRRKGVNTEYVSIRPDLRTPVADIIVGADGSRSSVSSRATLLEGYVPELPAVATASGGHGVRILSLASLFRAPLDDPGVICRLVREAHERGMIVCADTKLPTFRKIGLADIAEVLPMIDVFFPNEEEAAYYTGRQGTETAAEALLQMGIKTVVIKCGEKGCYATNGEERLALPAVPVRAVDTTGAGDNFAAGFISKLLDGGDLRACCEAGLEAAAKSIVHPGGV